MRRAPWAAMSLPKKAIEVEGLGHVDVAYVDVAEAEAPLIDVKHGGIEGLDLHGLEAAWRSVPACDSIEAGPSGGEATSTRTGGSATGWHRYARIHVAGGQHLAQHSLAELERMLDGTRFVRVHRSTIVNAQRVRSLRTVDYRDFELLLDDGTTVRLSRNYRERLGAALGLRI